MTETRYIQAQAHLHHAYFLGLQLMVSTRLGPKVVGDWMFRLFRRQHLDKFLSSFDKLGLNDLPHAVACAKYHVISNNMGGVGVEYMYESDQKAWVRFRYPRWMFHGPTICGVPVEVSRGFLNGWYAHNGVSLNNPRLGYVCVSEDMTGEFGLCGYFREFDHDLAESERLQFAKDEQPPPFVEADQPTLPANIWNEERRQKANRNYALEYVRNGLCELAEVIGTEPTRELGSLAARLIGLQYYPEIAEMIGLQDADLDSAAEFLSRMFAGMGDATHLAQQGEAKVIHQESLRIVRGLGQEESELVMACWQALWQGTMRSQRKMKSLTCTVREDSAIWHLANCR